MTFIQSLLDLLFHLDTFMEEFITNYGLLLYAVVFLIMFSESGIFLPLPGDSLIFACAAFAAKDLLNIWVVLLLCFSAAFFGGILNYYIGAVAGKRIYARARGGLFKRENIDKTQAFYEKNGGKAIIFSRFIPIIRQFTPFVAGIGKMSFRRFLLFNFIGCIAWVAIAAVAGYFLGNIPAVKNNFSTVILLIILVSLLPALIGFLKAKFSKKATS